MLLARPERCLGVAERLARCFPDRRDPSRITYTLANRIPHLRDRLQLGGLART